MKNMGQKDRMSYVVMRQGQLLAYCLHTFIKAKWNSFVDFHQIPIDATLEILLYLSHKL